MNLNGLKLWGSISLDKIKEIKSKNAKRFKTSEQYGQQMTFDAKQWEDGSISLSVSYKDETENWQRINFGNVRVSNDQSQAQPSPAASSGSSSQEGDSFGSPF